MSVIKIEHIAFVRFRVPDLGEMRAFLEDFGLVIAEATDRRLVSRGFGASPVLHIAEAGEPAFAGVGFRAASLEDLHTLARAEGVTVRPFDAPGGGEQIVLTDPDGHQVEVVAGQDSVPPLAAPEVEPWNSAAAKHRLRQTKRVPVRPSQVMRLGHCVLNVSNFRASEAWYKQRFGFITSDEIAVSPELSIGAFLRCDRGDAPTDHHTLFLAQAPDGVPGFNHAAFEVLDFDDLMAGHERLSAAGRRSVWGVGRHILGSQVFDYWSDPWGHTLEHWTDGDLFTAADGSAVATPLDLLGVQWGATFPADKLIPQGKATVSEA
ncbi:MAG: glyoxalase [Phenylobacterium sp.]|nr:glyoxalase [Phenylobacterium sp.]